MTVLPKTGTKEDVPHCLGPISQLLGHLDTVYYTVPGRVQFTEQSTVHCTA